MKNLNFTIFFTPEKVFLNSNINKKNFGRHLKEIVKNCQKTSRQIISDASIDVNNYAKLTLDVMLTLAIGVKKS